MNTSATNKPVELPGEPELPIWEPGQKRMFPEDFKRRAVAYYDSLPHDGSKGSYLRRSGIYSSSISQWREAIDAGFTSKPGRKPTDPILRENTELKTRVIRLGGELTAARTVIEVQKKISTLFESVLEQTS